MDEQLSNIDWQRLQALREFQESFGAPVADVETERPIFALRSLEDAISGAPKEYEDYLREALACYVGGQFRAAVLMVWSATVQHLYLVIDAHRDCIKLIAQANQARFGSSYSYRELKKVGDLLYLRDAQFIQVAEDAGLYNRNARQILEERLKLRNLCGIRRDTVPDARKP